jgi:hypothetical protein
LRGSSGPPIFFGFALTDAAFSSPYGLFLAFPFFFLAFDLPLAASAAANLVASN